MEEIKFKVYYDDTQMTVVENISKELYAFGLTIKELEGGDGWVEYQIEVIK
jgi:hypothetical protein